MNKFTTFLVAIMLIFIGTTAYSQMPSIKIKDNREKRGLKGKVKSLKSLEYLATLKEGEIEKKELLTPPITFKFNEKGNLIEEITFDHDNTLLYKKVQSYDEQSNLLETTFYDFDNKLDRKYTYEYDSEESRIVYSYNAENKLTKKEITKWNKKDNTKETTWYDTDGNLTGKVVYTYNKDGEIEYESWYNENGELMDKLITKNPFSKEDKEENPCSSEGVKCDENGNITEQIILSDCRDRAFISIYEIEYYK